MYELIIILLLLSFNGLLAMSEIAFVSSKKFKLDEKAKKGNNGARKALLLLEEPEKLLSAVQIGISLVGILAGAFGGYALAGDLTPYIKRIDVLEPYAVQISFALIVGFITYLSLVIGELVPKTIALNNPEGIAVFMAGTMYFISKLFTPVVWFLSISTKFFVLLLRIKKTDEPGVSEEELKALLEFGTIHGTFEKEESEMIKRIFSFNDKRAAEIMVPRIEIEWIEVSMGHKEVFDFISTHHYSRYVVCEENIDNFIGILDTRDFLIRYCSGSSFDLKAILGKPLVVPDTIYSIDLFERFRAEKTNAALVVDEYGGTQGLITLHDLVEDIVGDIPEKFEAHEQEIFKRKDNSYLADGSIEISRLSEILSAEFTPQDYTTLGGYLMTELGKIPEVGDIVTAGQYKYEVVDMDGKRVDKVLISKLEPADGSNG